MKFTTKLVTKKDVIIIDVLIDVADVFPPSSTKVIGDHFKRVGSRDVPRSPVSSSSSSAASRASIDSPRFTTGEGSDILFSTLPPIPLAPLNFHIVFFDHDIKSMFANEFLLLFNLHPETPERRNFVRMLLRLERALEAVRSDEESLEREKQRLQISRDVGERVSGREFKQLVHDQLAEFMSSSQDVQAIFNEFYTQYVRPFFDRELASLMSQIDVFIGLVNNLSTMNVFMKLISYYQCEKFSKLFVFNPKNKDITNNLKVQIQWITNDDERILYNRRCVKAVLNAVDKYLDSKRGGPREAGIGEDALLKHIGQNFSLDPSDPVQVTKVPQTTEEEIEYNIEMPKQFLILNLRNYSTRYMTQWINNLFSHFRTGKFYGYGPTGDAEVALKSALSDQGFTVGVAATKMGYLGSFVGASETLLGNFEISLPSNLPHEDYAIEIRSLSRYITDNLKEICLLQRVETPCLSLQYILQNRGVIDDIIAPLISYAKPNAVVDKLDRKKAEKKATISNLIEILSRCFAPDAINAIATTQETIINALKHTLSRIIEINAKSSSSAAAPAARQKAVSSSDIAQHLIRMIRMFEPDFQP